MGLYHSVDSMDMAHAHKSRSRPVWFVSFELHLVIVSISGMVLAVCSSGGERMILILKVRYVFLKVRCMERENVKSHLRKLGNTSSSKGRFSNTPVTQKKVATNIGSNTSASITRWNVAGSQPPLVVGINSSSTQYRRWSTGPLMRVLSTTTASVLRLSWITIIREGRIVHGHILMKWSHIFLTQRSPTRA